MNSFYKRLNIVVLLGLFLFFVLPSCSTHNSSEQDAQTGDDPKVRPEHKFYLPSAIDETSGLIFWNGECYSHNDSGGDEILYRFDTVNGDIDQRITIANGSNIDWEELAMDDNYIYVGDFGNNRGTRTDLKIYRIDKQLIPESGDANVTAEIINFSYEDQTDFSSRKNHNFDCEAMIATNNKIYLFSKNRGNEHTKMYELSNAPGTHKAVLRDEFDVNCLVTSADLSSSGELFLLGYRDGSWIPTIWLFNDYTADNFLQGSSKKFLFPSLFSQVEAVAFVEEDVVFISGEKTKASPQQLFRLNTTVLKNVN